MSAHGRQTPRRHRLDPRDGIGREVVPDGLRGLRAAASAFGFAVQIDAFDFACAEYDEAHGRMMPADWQEKPQGHDAIFFGAVGPPAKVPDHNSLWGSLVEFRRRFDQAVSLRPVRLMPGVRSPLANACEIDVVIVRENTEGEYSQVGGRLFEDTEREIVCQDTVMTRIGVDRIQRFALELARRRRKRVTSATKSNRISISMSDERFRAMAKNFIDAETENSTSMRWPRASC